MNDVQQIKLVKSDKEMATNVAITLVYLAAILYMMNPQIQTVVNGHVERVRAFIRHRISIWNAQEAIRSLPETDERL
jgi:hypothetical protein